MERNCGAERLPEAIEHRTKGSEAPAKGERVRSLGEARRSVCENAPLQNRFSEGQDLRRAGIELRN